MSISSTLDSTAVLREYVSRVVIPNIREVFTRPRNNTHYESKPFYGVALVGQLAESVMDLFRGIQGPVYGPGPNGFEMIDFPLPIAIFDREPRPALSYEPEWYSVNLDELTEFLQRKHQVR